ncbi:collagen alpha-2(I) chain-like [Pleurodeles waltl]|uniref:collagen alpha-2(I) chain-like n=1 Tax=Pleurodeles waltl TaxID=8319 RepID=UPI003709808C
MATGHDSEAVRAALRVLGEAGRADLLRPRVLDQARDGMTRPTRAASSGVAAAIAACESQDSEGDRDEVPGRQEQVLELRLGTPNTLSPLIFSGEAQGTQDPGPGNTGAGCAGPSEGRPTGGEGDITAGQAPGLQGDGSEQPMPGPSGIQTRQGRPPGCKGTGVSSPCRGPVVFRPCWPCPAPGVGPTNQWDTGPQPRNEGNTQENPGGAGRNKPNTPQARPAKHQTREEAGARGTPGPAAQGTWDQSDAWDLEARIREQHRAVAETEARWAQLCKDREEVGIRREDNKKGREAIDMRGIQTVGSGAGSWVWIPQTEAGRGQEAGAAEGQVGVGSPIGAYGHMGRGNTMSTMEVGKKKGVPTGRNTAQSRWSEAIEGSAAAFSTPWEHGYHNDGVRHLGQVPTETPATKPQGYVENKGGWVGEEELELDYEEDGEDWEDGEMRR